MEFALILPALLLLYLGMVQLTALLSIKHKLASAAHVMTDLVTRHRDVILLADINDYFTGAGLALADSAASEASIRVLVYGTRGGRPPAFVWSRQNRPTPTCPPPEPAELQTIALTGADIVVAVTCARIKVPMPRFLDFQFLPDTITLRQQSIMRPRSYLQINCRDCS